MKTFQQFREENYKQNPGPYSGGYDYPIPKGYPRDIMSKPIVDKEKGKFLNEPKFNQFLIIIWRIMTLFFQQLFLSFPFLSFPFP